MLQVGLTGGIGSGKSTVAARLVARGAVLVDSDRLAREVLEPGAPGLDDVVAAFGPGVLTADGALDRGALAARVFGDDAARAVLNGIVHPQVRARAAELAAAAPAAAVVVQDVPLLVEGGAAAAFPLVAVVHADPEVRVARLVGHRGMAEADARARIAAQADDARRRAAADVWLDNGGSREDTLAAVDRLWDERLVPFEEHLRTHRRAPRPPAPVLVDPDPTWPMQAERVRARVARAAGDRALRVDHIGSTAVPGLAAKDVLDVQIVVPDLDAAAAVADDLVAAGLVRLPGRWEDRGRDGAVHEKAVAANADPGRAVNCHVRPRNSPAWRDVLLFRDRLRADAADRRAYEDLKRRLAGQRWASVDHYADAKSPFVDAVLARAEEEAARPGWSPG